LSGCATVQN